MIGYNPKETWKRIVLESKSLLKESDGDSSIIDADLDGEDSVDNQIDSYLSQYEKTAKDALKENKDWRSTIKRLLTEADDEETEEEPAEDEEGVSEDEESGDEDDSDSEEDSKPKKLTFEDIDLSQFSNDVARLIENYDSLLEIRNTILRRALKYLNGSYNKSATDRFKDIMLNDYSLDIGATKKDNEERFNAPPAERAFGSGGGGGGGGI